MTPEERATRAHIHEHRTTTRLSPACVTCEAIAQQIRESVQLATSGACGCSWSKDGGAEEHMAEICDFHMDQAQEIENLKARLENDRRD